MLQLRAGEGGEGAQQKSHRALKPTLHNPGMKAGETGEPLNRTNGGHAK